MAVADVGVAPVTVRLVPPNVTVGKFVPVQVVTPVVVWQRPVPLMPIDVGVPDAFEVTRTEVIAGAAWADALANAAAIATARP